jgi:sec-independent protein translocase protein TatB
LSVFLLAPQVVCMFDIGFSEILVIAVVALIVIGPERLPGVARTLGHLFGRMQRYVNDVKADIQREMELDELKKLRQDVEDSARSIEDAARSFETSVTKEVNAAQDELRALETLADPAREPVAQQSEQPGVPASPIQPAADSSPATAAKSAS